MKRKKSINLELIKTSIKGLSKHQASVVKGGGDGVHKPGAQGTGTGKFQ